MISRIKLSREYFDEILYIRHYDHIFSELSFYNTRIFIVSNLFYRNVMSLGNQFRSNVVKFFCENI